MSRVCVDLALPSAASEPARAGRARRVLGWLARAALVGLVAFAPGCKHRRDKVGSIAELTPPKNAPDWEPRFGVVYDDSYTPTSINLQGRAPNDVLDQQLFQSRLGHAALVLLVHVEQVWGKGRFQGRQTQFVEITVEETLLGTLPKDAPEQIMIEVSSIDELPGSLKDEPMLLFVRWDLESEPPYHHHLMPADEEVVALINAMVNHAKVEGVLDKQGEETGKSRGKRKRAGKKSGGKKKSGKQGKRGDADSSAHELDQPGSAGTLPSGEPGPAPAGPIGPDEPPPSPDPVPDSSTGLQELGGEPAPKPSPEAPPEHAS
ncbi:hypothetical protein ACNOYE_17565 [Nannocystaceae bacterium ST9]